MEKEEFNRLFGEFVRDKRKSENWTQNDLAAKINNDFQNISRLERGEINPSIHWISQLAEGFGKSLGEFMTDFDRYCLYNKLEEYIDLLNSPGGGPGSDIYFTNHLGDKGVFLKIHPNDLSEVYRFMAIKAGTIAEYWKDYLTNRAEKDGVDLKSEDLYFRLIVSGTHFSE